MAPPRLTKSMIAVLEVLIAATRDAPAWGLSICMDADLGSGTVYPLLDRLSELGWVSSWQETGAHPGRPPRRYYELTNTGRVQALAALRTRRERRLRPLGGAAAS